ncbi:MAG: GDP-mannose 4,6-dehydratase [Gammaproteobacteria bacterium]|nr:MAG: GDP-mannose 4,6-dehydratase [Gammaproteobacteria bacterium]
MKRALICGVSGQDGAYLAKFLLLKGYDVYGTSRDANISLFGNLHRLGIFNDVRLLSMAPTDFRSVLQAFSLAEPNEVYFLAGQSSVGLSFEQPVETIESIVIGTLNILETIRFLGGNIRFYNAGSSECFGDTGNGKANEDTTFKPRSPYAVAKSAAFWQLSNYREAYGLYACSGTLFNHESNLRPKRFVTRKIVDTARQISLGSKEKLELGNVNIVRDWGWAPEYVEVMWMMLQQDTADDFVVATGVSISLIKFIELVFAAFELNYEKHIIINDALLRPTDLTISRANPEKVMNILGWKAQSDINDIIGYLVDDKI